ncbi:hypothetical protein [Lewinella sp. 4G2]|uniref:hypothetical protein n=1 Tax=Lewinella sp. 4G2 TaxID=1803372 RepID=UPI0007B46584|nr:hypothetical protein [Lewinella sp. 4G2]OAV43840.1 hypothetical protein A3850_004700 [Lewinella sp. 4G2]
MQVQVNESPRLKDGRHVVTITEVTDGRSEYKDIPFFSARMENEEGFVEQRFYNSEPSKPILAELMAAVGIEGEALNSEDLVGKSLSVEVGERSYADPETGNEKTITEASNFEAVGEADTSSVTA